MKKYLYQIVTMVIALFLFSCNKDSINNKLGYVGISKITYYADITISGDLYTTVPKGGTYTDPGATAVAGGKPVKLTVTGEVNTSIPGVYLVNYTAVNTDGFPATGTRYVIVYSTDATAQNNDFSGTYLRASNGQSSVWTKIAPGVYTVVNPGGAAGADFTVVVFNPTGYSIDMPQQIAAGSSASASSETSTPGSATGTLAGYSWIFNYPNYGAGVRSFTKQ